ncbi:MAG: transglutaminase-like cysteine peptidase [Hyphomicrobium sp.]|nr:transglutaminase-like cysteine peptidase [Hyphomicrobium sp.]
MKSSCVGVGIALSLWACGNAQAQDVASLEPAIRAPQFMRVFSNAQPPYGFVRFCEVHPEECAATVADDIRFQATPERLSELDEINREVNHEIEPATDAEIYGVNELWTIPKRRGDCEDFALLKRQRLMAAGWPQNALLITVVRDEKNEGHAILTARTSQGDFVLDNKIEAVRLWNQTPYHFVMRQSYIDPRVWVSLDATDPSTPGVMAGVKSNP